MVASFFGVTSRTVRNWASCSEARRPVGRPPHGAAVLLAAEMRRVDRPEHIGRMHLGARSCELLAPATVRTAAQIGTNLNILAG